MATGTAHARPPTAWSPLRLRAFRALWLAVLATNLGSWMHVVGVQWLVVNDFGGESMVALVHTAITLPTVLLAMPGGVLADILSRTRLLIGVQLFVAAVVVLTAWLTAAGAMDLGMILMLTFALGAGAALTAPAVGALIPDLVPREQLVEASALGAVSVNAARAIGPAVGGLLIARAGAALVFALHAAAVLTFVGVLALGRLSPPGPADQREQFVAALRAGGRYVRYTPVVRRILLRAMGFVVPATAVWALLPLVARRELGMGASGYGILLAALGVGAIAGAVALPRLSGTLPTTWTIAVASLTYAAAMLVLAAGRHPLLLIAAMVPAGTAWVAVLADINAQMQTFLPAWVRARGLSAYQVALFGGQAVAALGWGVLAARTGLRVTFVAAAALLAVGVLALVRRPLHDTSHVNQSPAMYWPQPHLVLDPEPATGPVMISVTYTVRPQRQAAFLRAMAPLRESRLRSGATQYRLFQDGAAPRRFVEAFLVPSWEEHLRQHAERLTVTDEDEDRRSTALADGPPVIVHLLPAPVPRPDDASD